MGLAPYLKLLVTTQRKQNRSCQGFSPLLIFLVALCEIQWVIKLHFSTEKVNHIDKVVDIAVSPGASFG